MDELTSFADLSALNDDETVSIKFFRSLWYNYCLVTLINKVINGSILVKTIMQVWVVGWRLDPKLPLFFSLSRHCHAIYHLAAERLKEAVCVCAVIFTVSFVFYRVVITQPGPGNFISFFCVFIVLCVRVWLLGFSSAFPSIEDYYEQCRKGVGCTHATRVGNKTNQIKE